MAESKKSSGPDVNTAFVVVAMLCGLATVVMGLVAFSIISRFNTISDFMTFSIAAMVVPPALMGVGISNFIYKTHLAQLQYRSGKQGIPDSVD